MPKICYIPKTFRGERLTIIEQTNAILAEYKAAGMSITLRGIYYQFIARDLLPETWADKTTGSKNCERSYKNLGACLNDARLAGLVDWVGMDDETRELDNLSHWNSPSEIIAAIAAQYRVDRWTNQNHYVEVWIEKDALQGVIRPVCRRNDVPFFSCRGYVSQSAMWNAGQRLADRVSEGKQVLVLHLGDHDPSGIDMTNDITARLRMFSSSEEIEVKRIALNMNQVRQYNPPPNPCKITDSRASAYMAEHGDESWELDALEPKVLDKLIQKEIDAVKENETWAEAEAEETGAREKLSKLSVNWDDISSKF